MAKAKPENSPKSLTENTKQPTATGVARNCYISNLESELATLRDEAHIAATWLEDMLQSDMTEMGRPSCYYIGEGDVSAALHLAYKLNSHAQKLWQDYHAAIEAGEISQFGK